MGNILFHLQFPAPTLPEQVELNTFFESLDGWTKQTAGGGTIAIDGNEVTITTPGIAFAYNQVFKIISYSFYAPTFDKKRWLKTRAWLTNGANQGEVFIIMSGNPDTPKGFGFVITNNVVNGYTGNGTSGSYLALETIPAGAYSWEKNLEAILYPGVKVEFYIDGTLVGTKTTLLPTGVPHAARLLHLKAQCNDNVASRVLHISHARVIQEI